MSELPPPNNRHPVIVERDSARNGAAKRWRCLGCDWGTDWTHFSGPFNTYAAAAVRHAAQLPDPKPPRNRP